ncbi:glycosyltransferase [Modestobacter sp. VKM Ac-2984]|nr:glycosyltransferase [Modestobacter sp. VKM Ac-2984]MCZ2817367.1 glycosyltransferase [Modestobacter sp. VKM Ac-2984]
MVIAHDYLTQRGGAERVALALLEAFPGSRMVTSIYAPESTYPEFERHDIEVTPLSSVPAFRRDPRRALPLLAAAWASVQVNDADVVLCSSSGWAHGIRTTAPKIVYCHNPARWLYQSSEYIERHGRAQKVASTLLRRPLVWWDRRAAASAQLYLANSLVVARRVERTYGRPAQVVHPPMSVRPKMDRVPGIEPGSYFLTVGRPRGYKNTTVVAEAITRMPDERLIAVGGLPEGQWPDRLRGLTGVTDAQLTWLYANAKALIACAYEDFGLTPLESFSQGTPVLALRAGGYVETTIAGVTGEFIDEPTADSIISAVRRFLVSDFDAEVIRQHADSFSQEAFTARIRDIVFSQLRQPALT